MKIVVPGSTQRRKRTRASAHAARKNKGHPLRQERRERAYARGAPRPEEK